MPNKIDATNCTPVNTPYQLPASWYPADEGSVVPQTLLAIAPGVYAVSYTHLTLPTTPYV